MANVISLGLIGMGEGSETKETFQAKLAAADPLQTLYIDIHSEGGGVFDGFAIYDLIKEYSGKTVARVKSAAFSVASYIAMAADEVQIAANGYFMVHNPWAEVQGDDKELTKQAKLLSEMRNSMVQAYAEKTGMGVELINELMSEETYINATKAKELGMADSIIEVVKAQPQNRMPARVFAVLYGGDSVPKTETSKPEKSKMALTPSMIRSIVPRANNKFIVKCLDEDLDEEGVAKAHAVAVAEENDELKKENAKLKAKAMEGEEEETDIMAKLAAMEEEVVALRALVGKAQEEEEPVAMEEEEPVARAKRKLGVAPVKHVARQVHAKPAREEWEETVSGYIAKGFNRQKALMAANKSHKHVRLRMLEEIA